MAVGGMKTKLEAAEICMGMGIVCWIGNLETFEREGFWEYFESFMGGN